MATLAHWCFRHRLAVVLIWVAALIALVVTARSVGSAYSTSFVLGDTESSRALTLLQSTMPKQAGDTATIVWHVDGGSVNDPTSKTRIEQMLAQVGKAKSVAAVKSPWAADPENPLVAAMAAQQISRDGKTAFATVEFTKQAMNIPLGDIEEVMDLAHGARAAGLEVELNGTVIAEATRKPPSYSLAIGLVAAAIILWIAFGSWLGMTLPLITAITALTSGYMAISLLSHAVSIPSMTPTLAELVGLGVGIDYALFIVSRHRDGLKGGMSPEESSVRALDTSGRAVLFAGGTVCIALLGLLVLRMGFLSGMAYGSSVTVLFTMATAITMLPALFGFMGMRVLSKKERARLAQGHFDAHHGTHWARWAAFVQRRPVILAVSALIVILALASPVLDLRLGSSDQGNDPASSTTRKAYDLLAAAFGPGSNGPLLLVAEIGSPADQAALKALIAKLSTVPDVAAVAAMPSAPDAKIALIQVIPASAPQDKATSDLIRNLRDDVIPAATQGSTLRVYVGGSTAIFDDFATVIQDKLPLFIGVIVLLGSLLLFVAFRSLLVPATAAVMNLLAAAASFGVIVAVFQWGWLSAPLGLGKAGPIEAFLPVIMLAILFGLSMDYQVFLVSRMHEEWIHSKDNSRAVRVGQAATGRVITAAAAIMACVFIAFVFTGQRVIAEVGIGLAAAVLIDAFILRTLLVPALMHVFGKANWWLPGAIDRYLPHLAVEPTADLLVGERRRPGALGMADPSAPPDDRRIAIVESSEDEATDRPEGPLEDQATDHPEASLEG
jgi:putative drug exporter of the RND superfamily